MKILFLTDNFPPEVNAPAIRTYEHCKEWVKLGAEVTVITCFPNFPQGKVYEGYKNKWKKTEWIDGIKVIRVWSYMAPNTGFIKRTFDFISFSISSFLTGLFINTDVIIATSPQFFTALSGRELSFWKRKPWIMEIRDLYPEQILAATNMKRNLFIRFFERQELECYKSAKLLVSVTDSFVDKITKRGITREKFVVIKNGVDTSKFLPSKKDEYLLKKFSFKNKFVIGFIGTHGLSQDLSFIIDCIYDFNKIEQYKEVHFLFVGTGSEKERIFKLANKLNIPNITFVNQVNRTEIIRYLTLIDIGLVPLRKSELYLTVIPSKIFELAAMEIPILIGVDGEARLIIEKYNCGIFYEPGNKNDFINKLNYILKDENKLTEFKIGSKNLVKDFERVTLALKMLESIKKTII